MRIRQLEIEHFGVFVGHQLQFPGSGPHVIYGPNEAGKSTLLQLIREVLFGFTIRNPYAFAEHAGEMAAVVELEMADGAQVRFRRRKGRRNEVVGEHRGNGQAIDASALQRLLGGASAELFQNVFGFSLAELASGQQSLEHARLSEALYGGALGSLTGFQRVLDGLEKDQDTLFSPAATKKPINRLVSSLRRQGKELRAALVRPRDFERSEKELKDLRKQVEQLRAQRDKLHRRQARCTQLTRALSLWRERAQLQTELEQLDVPADFPRDGEQQYESARAAREQVAAELEDFQQELAEIAVQLERLSPQADVMDRSGQIKQLAQQLDKIRGFRRDIVLREQESLAVKTAVSALLRELDPNWALDQLEAFQFDVAQNSSLAALQEEWHVLIQRQRELQGQRPALEADIQDMERRLAALPQDHDGLPFAELIDLAPEYESRREKLEMLQQQSRDVEAQIDALQRKLNAPFATERENLADLAVPLASTVETFWQQYQELQQRSERADLDLDRATADLDERKQELAQLQQEEQVPDQEQLDAARERRQQGWNLIRRRFCEEDSVPEGDIIAWLQDRESSLPDEYERSVVEADRIADQRQADAEIVARVDQLAGTISLGQERYRAAETARESLRGEFQSWQELWREAWAASGIQPEAPDAMLQWLGLRDALVDAAAQAAALQGHMQSQQVWLNTYEANLDDALSDYSASSDAQSATAQIAEARRRLQAARDSAAERKTYVAQLPRKQHQLATLEQEMEKLTGQLAAWQAKWSQLVESCGFPSAWDVNTVSTVIRGLSDARAQHRESTALDLRIRDMAEGIAQFEQEVEGLCRELAPSLAEQRAENAVEELFERLENTRQEVRDQQVLLLQHAKLETRSAAKERQLQKEQDRIDGLVELAGVAQEEELPRLAARVRRWFEVTDAIEALDHQLRAIRDDEDADAFVAALEEVDPAELDSERQVVAAQLEQLEVQFNDALQRLGVATKQLQDLDQASQAATLVQDIESARSELVDCVDRLAPLVLARSFMRQAIDRFEREHQPQLLIDVGRLLSRMTAGKYNEISRKLDEESSLLIHHSDGQVKEPHQLSTGTREQLYLAIRLAYVLHYCRETEPLPVIMDDVLVNFDDQRSAATLEALIEVSQELQVILLTCHQQTVDLVRSQVVDLEPIALD